MRELGWRQACLIAVLVAALVVAPNAAAQSPATDGKIAVAAGETHDGNLYAFGESLQIDGTVTGDVVGAARLIHIGPQGRVRGDVLAAAYAVQVDGQVDGAVRAAAYMIEIGAGSVGGDLAAAGFSHDVGDTARIGQDVLAIGYQMLLDGTVAGDVRFVGAAMDIDGTVAGDVHASVDAADDQDRPPDFARLFAGGDDPQPSRSASPGLAVGPEAEIGGTLTYTSPSAVDIPSQVAEGGVVFNEVRQEAESGGSDAREPESPLWMNVLRSFLSLAILGLLALWLLPRLVMPASAMNRARPAASLGHGLLAWVADIAALVALVIAFVLVAIFAGILQLGGGIGWPAVATLIVGAVLLTGGFMLILLLGTIVAGNAIGGALLRNDAAANAPRRVCALLLGLAIVAVLEALPWGLGFLFGLFFGLLGLGGLVLSWLESRSRTSASRALGPAPVLDTV